MTTNEFLQELETRINDGRVVNTESYLRRNGKTRIAASKDLQDTSKWKRHIVTGKQIGRAHV